MKRRNNHSNPIYLITNGARGTEPLIKSKEPPTPIAAFIGNVCKFSEIHSSCLGTPYATKRISICLGAFFCGHSGSAKTTFIQGYFCFKHSAVRFATPALPPKKPMDTGNSADFLQI